MPSSCIAHVKKYASEHNISYKEALKKPVQLIKKLNKKTKLF